MEAVQDAVGHDDVIMWRQKAGPRVAAARGLFGRRTGAPCRGDDTPRPGGGLQAVVGLPAVASLPTQIVAMQAGLQAAWQTLSGHSNRLHEWTTRVQARAAIEMAEKVAKMHLVVVNLLYKNAALL